MIFPAKQNNQRSQPIADEKYANWDYFIVRANATVLTILHLA